MTFHWIAVLLSMILGLGVARLLTSAVSVFQSRRRAQIDYLPLIWSSAIFIQQILFWWSLAELPTLITTWFLPEFLLLVSLVLALFLAASPVLPHWDMGDGDSLRI